MEPMREEPFDLEDTLQELIADHPQLLSGEQINPGDPRRWILIRREQGIPDIEGGSDRWALDHLLIDQEAIPTLVEVKRSANSEIRRTIVGQMLDYAAHATRTWNSENIRRAFEESREDPGDELARLLQSDAEPNAGEFWQRVETNLRAARVRLLFVADGIPDELSRVVEFLNEQMLGIEVLAVEIKQFRGATGQTLVPRVIGRTAAVPQSRRNRNNTSQQALIESFSDAQAQQAANRLFEVASSHGATYGRSAGGISIRLRCAAWGGREVTVAWLYKPLTQGWMRAGGFIFGAGNGDKDFFDGMPENLRELLEDWTSRFSDDPFTQEVIYNAGLKAWTITHEDAAANIDVLAERLASVLRELAALPSDGYVRVP